MSEKPTPVESDEIKKISIADLETQKGGQMSSHKHKFKCENHGDEHEKENEKD